MRWSISLLAGFAILLLGCGSAVEPPPSTPAVSRPHQPLLPIVLGDIDPSKPTEKIKRFKPLADYLAENLAGLGIDGGRVVIARDADEMARLLRDGRVDLYFDSPFPALAVQESSGSRFILRRWKGGESTYWSTYAVLRESGITTVEDFAGKVMAFEEPHSTSGFVLPAGSLMQRGLTLREVPRSSSTVASDEVGYIFSGDEENTFELILQGDVAGGGISNQDYEELPQELKERIAVIDRTISVPRQLVSVRADLDPEIVDRVSKLLISLELTEEGRELLESLKNTKRFDPLPPGSDETLAAVREMLRLVDR